MHGSGKLAFGAVVKYKDPGVCWTSNAPDQRPPAPSGIEEDVVFSIVG
jgi:hypothetical protein